VTQTSHKQKHNTLLNSVTQHITCDFHLLSETKLTCWFCLFGNNRPLCIFCGEEVSHEEQSLLETKYGLK